ncbi:FG-nucleoporin NUP1 TDEL_0F01400 [Torulaspora delbrueckii]|uniref:Uncharacterized protein n=1 Tax=Torulaspora delbrueckii TaxID=4950 RepID=G8ZWF7_TORDE|nr:hypothetical protein TDEL_0F01400 [Torulaspora delbrueckii]CCE92951.1 hypothetical protein TDEL_0F01400 [Torulaspora delbrueckii]
MDVKKRSISSSIVDFFRKPADGDIRAYDSESVGVGATREPADENGANDTSMGFQGSIYSMNGDIAPPNFQDSMILYETGAGTDTQVRPPILPILPVQRLRLLRQKQEWRRKLTAGMLGSLPVPMVSDISVLNPIYSRESSSTPSPVKNTLKKDAADGLKSLKRKKVSNVRSKGTKWTADFDYDLSEYDNHKAEAKAITNDTTDYHMDSPTLSMTKRSTLPKEYPQDVNTNTLSKTQRDLLLKGQPSAQSVKKSGTSAPESKQLTLRLDKLKGRDSEKAILPSAGFDFIKASDTPSKISPAKANGLQTPTAKKAPTLTFSSQAEPSSKPAFNFASSKTKNDSTHDDEEDEPRRKKAARNDTGDMPKLSSNATSDGNKPQFSFGSKQTSDDKQASPSFTFSSKSDPKPAIRFTKEVNDDQKDKITPVPSFALTSANEKKIASFSFGTKPIDTSNALPEASKSAEIPKANSSAPKLSFNFGSGASSSNNEAEKPSFSFGSSTAAGKKDTSTAPSFTFGNGALSEKKDTTTAPAFSFGKGAAPDTAGAPATAPAFSFGVAASSEKKDTPTTGLSFGGNAKPETKDSGTAPSISFDTDSASEQKKPLTAPSFSFGDGSKKGSTAPPSFSFTKNNEASDNGQKEPPKTAFNFGSTNASDTKSESASQPNGGFSFNRPPEGNISKPSFTFGKADTSENNAPSFGLNNASTVASPAANNSAFTFNKSGPPATKTDGPSFGFKFGADNSSTGNTAQNPAPPMNPFINGSKPNNGFSFGSSAGNTGAIVQPSFQQPQPLQSAFGTTPSPAFGKSASPPVISGSNNPSRTFTPSNTINLNFGNNGPVDPTSVFSGGPGPAAPQQVFGATPPPSQIFGATSQAPASFNNAPVGFGSSGGIAAGQLAPMAQQQAPAPNFQMPPGRKLARMRHSRR